MIMCIFYPILIISIILQVAGCKVGVNKKDKSTFALVMMPNSSEAPSAARQLHYSNFKGTTLYCKLLDDQKRKDDASKVDPSKSLSPASHHSGSSLSSKSSQGEVLKKGSEKRDSGNSKISGTRESDSKDMRDSSAKNYRKREADSRNSGKIDRDIRESRKLDLRRKDSHSRSAGRFTLSRSNWLNNPVKCTIIVVITCMLGRRFVVVKL